MSTTAFVHGKDDTMLAVRHRLSLESAAGRCYQPTRQSGFADGTSHYLAYLRRLPREHLLSSYLFRNLESDVHNAARRTEDQGPGTCVPEVSRIQLHAHRCRAKVMSLIGAQVSSEKTEGIDRNLYAELQSS
jgi:hypothetical protein